MGKMPELNSPMSSLTKLHFFPYFSLFQWLASSLAYYPKEKPHVYFAAYLITFPFYILPVIKPCKFYFPSGVLNVFPLPFLLLLMYFMSL